MNVLDIVIAAIVLIIMASSAHKGFLMSLFNISAYVLSAILAKLFSPAVSQYVYESFLSKRIISELNTIIPTGSVDGEISAVFEEILGSLPAPVTSFVRQFGLLPDFSQKAAGSRFTVGIIEHDYLMPIITKITSFFIIVLLFILFSAIIKIVLRFVNRRLTAKKHRLIRGGNKLLGAVLGIVKGLIPAGFVCAVLNIAVPFFGSAEFTQLVSSSFFCKIIADMLK